MSVRSTGAGPAATLTRVRRALESAMSSSAPARATAGDPRPRPPARPAVKVNPVTGAMTAVPRRPAGGDGKRRDGCVAVDEKYMHAALDAGLGGRDGMYGHMTSIRRAVAPSGGGGGVEVSGGGGRRRGGGGDLGGGGGDEEEGEVEGPRGARVATLASLKAAGGGGGAGSAPAGSGTGGPRIRQVVQGRTRGVGPAALGIHAHEASFLRAKGVVNTLGGASDLNRKPRGAEGGAAAVRGGHVASLGDYAAPASKREAAAAAAAPTGKGVVHTLSGAFDSSARGGGAAVTVRDGRVGGAGSVGPRSATSRAVKAAAARPAPRAAAATSSGGGASSGRVGGTGGSGGKAIGADTLRAKRAEFYEAKFAAAAGGGGEGGKENADGAAL